MVWKPVVHAAPVPREPLIAAVKPDDKDHKGTPRRKGGDRKVPTCYKCGVPGHIAKGCDRFHAYQEQLKKQAAPLEGKYDEDGKTDDESSSDDEQPAPSAPPAPSARPPPFAPPTLKVPHPPTTPRKSAPKPPPDGGGGPPPSGGGPGAPKPKDPKAEPTPEEKLSDLMAELRQYAGTRLLTKNLESSDDRNVTLRGMAAIADKRQAYLLPFEEADVAELLNNIYLQQLHRAASYQERRARHERHDDSDTPDVWRVMYWGWFNRAQQVLDVKSRFIGPVGRINMLRGQPMLDFGRVKGVCLWFVYMLARLVCLLMPISEEVGKRAATELFVLTTVPTVGYVYRIATGGPIDLLHPLRTHMPHLLAQLCAAAAITLLESRRRSSYLGLLARLLAHWYLVSLPLGYAIVAHLLWNALASQYKPDAKLSLMESVARVSKNKNNKTKQKAELDLTSGSRVYADVCCDDYDMKAVPTQSEFKVRWGPPACEPRHGVRIAWGLKRIIPTVFRNCHHNEKISLCGRVGKDLPVHSSESRVQIAKRAWRLLGVCVLPWVFYHVQPGRKPVRFDVWLKHLPARRRDLFIKIRSVRDGLQYVYMRAASFIKRENANKDRCNPVFKDPRMIQGCPPELTAYVGPWLSKLATMVKRAFKPVHWLAAEIYQGKHIFYTSGSDAEQVGDAFGKAIALMQSMCEPGETVCFVLDDQSRFDLHLIVGAFLLAGVIYAILLPRWVANILKRTAKMKGRTAKGTRYTVPYTMQSGWPDTAVLDTIFNLLMKAGLHGIGRRWVSIICGDDSVTVTIRSEVDALGGRNGIIAYYDRLGMEAKVQIVDDPLDVDFCSGRFAPREGTYVLVPKIGRFLAKICADRTDRKEDDQLAWLRGIISVLEQFGKMDPVIAALGVGLRRSAGEGRVIEHVWNPYKHRVSDASVKRLDYLTYVNHHYGWNADDVDRLVALLEKAEVGDICDHPLLEQAGLHDL